MGEEKTRPCSPPAPPGRRLHSLDPKALPLEHGEGTAVEVDPPFAPRLQRPEGRVSPDVGQRLDHLEVATLEAHAITAQAQHLLTAQPRRQAQVDIGPQRMLVLAAVSQHLAAFLGAPAGVLGLGGRSTLTLAAELRRISSRSTARFKAILR